MSTKPYAVTVEHAPLEQEDIRRADKRGQDRAYRLYLDVQREWIDNLDLAELLIPLLGFINSGGALDEDADSCIRFVYNLQESDRG